MKKIISLCFSLFLLSMLSACRFPASTAPAYRPPDVPTATAEVTGPTQGETAIPSPQESTPTKPLAVTATLAPQQSKPSPTATTQPTKPAPTNTPKPTTANEPTKTAAPTFASVEYDPHKQLGKPTFADPLDTRSSITNWGDKNAKLPDSTEFEISIIQGQYYVTGKKPGFSTWWFTWPEPKNLFLELVADSEDCTGKDAYGLILRGPAHLAGTSYGYVAEISCDGEYRVFRLDSANPWTIEPLVDWKASDLINEGPYSTNVLGMQMIGTKLTVYINNKSVAEVTDDTYKSGRFGLFVGSDDSHAYTYHPQDLYYWEIKK